MKLPYLVFGAAWYNQNSDAAANLDNHLLLINIICENDCFISIDNVGRVKHISASNINLIKDNIDAFNVIHFIMASNIMSK